MGFVPFRDWWRRSRFQSGYSIHYEPGKGCKAVWSAFRAQEGRLSRAVTSIINPVAKYMFIAKLSLTGKLSLHYHYVPIAGLESSYIRVMGINSEYCKVCVIIDNFPAASSSSQAMATTSKFCEICGETKDKEEEMFAVGNCSHLFCTECITKYIEVQLTEKRGNPTNAGMVRCPAGLECGTGFLEINECMEILPENVLSMWDGLICESTIDSLGEKFYCPYKDCSGLMAIDNDIDARESECPYCHRLLCAWCKVPWHSGVECKPDRGGGLREDRMVEELAKEKKWRRCPRCNFLVEKSQGCLHITCRCGYEFCYACGAKWSLLHGGCQ